MKVFTTNQIKELDQYTILKEPIESIDLMERASMKFADAFKIEVSPDQNVFIFAGPGNNGGDALAIARLLIESGYPIQVFLFNPKGDLSADCEANKQRLISIENINFQEINSTFSPPEIKKDDVIIDGLFGSGLNSPLSGGFAAVVKHINQTGATIYSIDMPSGLFGEDNTRNTSETIVKATKTFSFQTPKLAFFLAENEVFTGKWELLDIGLHPHIINDTPTPYHYTSIKNVSRILIRRPKFSHKGNFGHALLIAGSKGKIGSAVLSARACLKSGTGLLTCSIPSSGNEILQTNLPEAMSIPDKNPEFFSELPDLDPYSAIGVGPGIGLHGETSLALQALFHRYKKPMIIDADALNLIARDNFLLGLIPAKSILTPHPKEFDRLAGTSANSYERLQKAIDFAAYTNCYVILKGAYSVVITPQKECHFNSTGNPGMATAGSGDVLTGILTGLLAQGYTSFETALLGTYIHGLAGDLALQEESEESLIAGDIIRHLGLAFETIRNYLK